jgi:hypothetical protein
VHDIFNAGLVVEQIGRKVAQIALVFLIDPPERTSTALFASPY